MNALQARFNIVLREEKATFLLKALANGDQVRIGVRDGSLPILTRDKNGLIVVDIGIWLGSIFTPWESVYSIESPRWGARWAWDEPSATAMIVELDASDTHRLGISKLRILPGGVVSPAAWVH